MKTIILLTLSFFTYSAQGATYSFSSDSISIPIKGPSDPSFIHVEGLDKPITDITIRIHDFTHSYGGDTMLAVSNPDGWTTLLWARASCRFNQTTMTFTDSAARLLNDDCSFGNNIVSGTEYKPGYDTSSSYDFTIPIAPERPYFKTLSELIFDNLNGRWILWAEDFINGDGGSISKWELIITTED